MSTGSVTEIKSEPEGAREASRRAGILEAARGLFTRFGYKKTTMDEIAKAAGITKPTIYTYFEGKKGILVGLVEWEASQVLDKGLASQDLEAAAPEQLRSMFMAVDTFLKGDSFLQGIVTRDPDILTPEVLNIAFGFERRIMDAVAKILEQGMEEGTVRRTDPKLLAYATVRLHEAFTFSAFFDSEGYTDEQVNDFFVEMMTAAVQPP